MRFAIGYQLADPDEISGGDSIVEVVRDYREHVAEVYFPWTEMASGRSPLATRRGCTDWSAQQRLEEDLLALRQMGVGLDLLLNANCHGGRAISRHLENQVGSLLEYLGERVGGVDVVTTASPFIARCVKKHFPQVQTRASVNMRIGTIQGMSYLADLFDGFYVQRDSQRDLNYCRRLQRWAQGQGKSLFLLANSGCFAFCSGQTFHDNLVAHEAEIAETENVTDWNPILCWRRLKTRANWKEILQSTWVRPEDLYHYDGLFDVVKLATRMHERPRLVLDAYVRRRHHGNLLDLFEPAFGPALAPTILDNTRFPAEWFGRTSTCGRLCESCNYCEEVLQAISIQTEEFAGINDDLDDSTPGHADQPTLHQINIVRR